MRGKWQDGEELGGAEEHMICPAAPILAEGPARYVSENNTTRELPRFVLWGHQRRIVGASVRILGIELAPLICGAPDSHGVLDIEHHHDDSFRPRTSAGVKKFARYYSPSHARPVVAPQRARWPCMRLALLDLWH